MDFFEYLNALVEINIAKDFDRSGLHHDFFSLIYRFKAFFYSF